MRAEGQLAQAMDGCSRHTQPSLRAVTRTKGQSLYYTIIVRGVAVLCGAYKPEVFYELCRARDSLSAPQLPFDIFKFKLHFVKLVLRAPLLGPG